MKLFPLFLLAASAAFSLAHADTMPTTLANTYRLVQTAGNADSVIQAGLTDQASCIAAAAALAEKTQTSPAFACRAESTFAVAWSAPCPVLPASSTASRTNACPAGFTGSWAQTQTTTYASAPKPACSAATVGAWLPAAAPASACTAAPLPTAGYVLCAAENATCKLPVTTPATPGMTILYGAGTTWAPTLHVTKDTLCANTPAGPFADPVYGVVKACWVKFDAPAAQDMSKAVQIDMSKIVPSPIANVLVNGYPKARNSDARMLVPADAKGVISACCTTLPASDGVGAFRVNCNFGGMVADDPLVFPGQPGVSHLHTYVGNLGFNAYLTAANQRSAANLKLGSTCGGGTLNMSSYWVPTMIDFGAGGTLGVPMALTSINVYYKHGYYLSLATPIATVPNGLHVITGNAKNVNQAGADHGRFICMGPKGENPGWQPTIPAAMAAARLAGQGNCAAGSDFIIDVAFPQCWDGVNLDSPNHQSHMADPVWHPTGFTCPADHPVAIPQINFEVHYAVKTDGAPDRWRFSSDAFDASVPAGDSSHGDYFFGWDPTVLNLWSKNCVQAANDCHDNLLGDGTMLY